MKNKKQPSYEIHICFSEDEIFGIHKHERFVVAVDNRSSHVYITENKSKNRISMSKENYMKEYDGKVKIIQVIESNNYEDWLEFQTIALEKTKILIIIENEEMEDYGQKALLNVLNSDILLSGDEYHEKISPMIDGYIEALKDCDFLVKVNTVSINRTHSSFKVLDFDENPDMDYLYNDDKSS